MFGRSKIHFFSTLKTKGTFQRKQNSIISINKVLFAILQSELVLLREMVTTGSSYLDKFVVTCKTWSGYIFLCMHLLHLSEFCFRFLISAYNEHIRLLESSDGRILAPFLLLQLPFLLQISLYCVTKLVYMSAIAMHIYRELNLLLNVAFNQSFKWMAQSNFCTRIQETQMGHILKHCNISALWNGNIFLLYCYLHYYYYW